METLDIILKQKQAIRIITGSKFNAHTEPLFKSSGILPFTHLSQFFKLQLMQQYHQNLLPKKFQCDWVKNSECRRDEDEDALVYHTCNFDDFYITFSRLCSDDKLLLVAFPYLWNNFPHHDIKIIRKKLEFKFKLKQSLEVKEVITCDRLLC
jgi:hypothetical protein